MYTARRGHREPASPALALGLMWAAISCVSSVSAVAVRVCVFKDGLRHFAGMTVGYVYGEELLVLNLGARRQAVRPHVALCCIIFLWGERAMYVCRLLSVFTFAI